MEMSRTATTRGFTLLEILVALALIGGLFVGIGAILRQQADTQYRLEERLAAAQVASNQMELFRANGLPPTPDQVAGDEEMAGRTLPWIRRVSRSEDGLGFEVTILVGLETAPLFVERFRWLGH
ncbi:MAG: type II secretion system minor pseudopilin GspI [Magnetococcales bacterium]|nr:type II secretion system minor pseudopilin GspI [Magnetococcales bacterium]